MITIQGKGVSKGIGKGPLYFLKRQEQSVVRSQTADFAAEKARFVKAQEETVDQLNRLSQQCREEAGEEAAVLFETHAMFAEDEDYTACIQGVMETERCNAEYAVQQAGEQFAAMFASMDDVYMQARAADILDVSRRMIRNLHMISKMEYDAAESERTEVQKKNSYESTNDTGKASCDSADDTGKDTDESANAAGAEQGWTAGGADIRISSDVPVILAADDMTPSETIQLDKKKILAFVTQRGSGNSHTAILARMLGIPAVCGLGDALSQAYSGKMTYVDGESGQIFVEPDEQTSRVLDDKYQRQQEYRLLLQSMKGKEDVTLDGRRIEVCCNISSPEDVQTVLEQDGRGIGLFRSEVLYLSSDDYPTEEEQFRAYQTVAAAMEGKRVVIRTLDIGADKQVGYFHMSREENPALGVRGIRVCLKRPELFYTQLRALYRASAYGKVAVMFPMITSVWEVKECRQICQKVMEELDRDGIPYNKDTEIGIMIETPASVFMAEELAREVDFFSVGTNDLTQYLLACDRQCSDLGRFYDPHHPAVLRALNMAADAAHKAGIWIGICGELGADLSLLPEFLAMGIDELSVAPSEVLRLRAEIRKSYAGQIL